MNNQRFIRITILFSMITYACQEQKFINIVLTPRDWQDPTKADGFFCGTDVGVDAGRLLAEFNTNFIFKHVDKTQDITPDYRTIVIDMVAFNKNEEPIRLLDQTSCNLEKEESGLFIAFLAPGTKQCNRQTFEDASNEDGYHPIAVLVSSNFTDITEQFISKAETYKALFGGIHPKLCATGLMMSNETANSRRRELTSIFNFPFNEDRSVVTSTWKMCQTADDTMHSITKSTLFDINSDMIFKYESQSINENAGFVKIEILKKSSSNKIALGFVTTDYLLSGDQCSPASDKDIVPLSNFVVFNACEEETEVMVRVKQDMEIEEAECFQVLLENVTEMQGHKRMKRNDKEKKKVKNKKLKMTKIKIQDDPPKKFNLKPGSKIGRLMLTGELPDPAKFGYGTLGAFLKRAKDDGVYILTNGHVVDWTIGQTIYFYYQDQGTASWSSKLLGKVSKSTDNGDVARGLDAAAIRIKNLNDWNIDYEFEGTKETLIQKEIKTVKLMGSAPAVDEDRVFTYGAKTQARIYSEIIDNSAKGTLPNKNKIRNTKTKKNVSDELIEFTQAIELNYGKNTNPTNEPGDSGSVLVRCSDSKVVGLFFSMETNQYKLYGYACHIQPVLDFLSKGGEPFTIKAE